MVTKKILIADASEEFRSALNLVLGGEEEFSVVAETGDGAEAVALARELVPDVIVMDLVLNGSDGFKVLEALRDLPTRSLVLSAFIQRNIAQEIARFGGDYYMTKPCCFTSLVERVRLLGDRSWEEDLLPQPSYDRQSLEVTITDLLRQIGVPANIRGHGYLRDAITVSIVAPDALQAVTKVLYPDVAKRHGTTASRVERAIRHAIEVAWSRGSLEVLEHCFGGIVSPDKGKPTNSEFIATVAERVRLGVAR